MTITLSLCYILNNGLSNIVLHTRPFSFPCNCENRENELISTRCQEAVTQFLDLFCIIFLTLYNNNTHSCT